MGLLLLLALGGQPVWHVGNWTIKGSRDPRPTAKPIRLEIEGKFVGSFSRIEFHHPVKGFGWPQVVALDGAGYIRLCPPVAEWGASFVFTGYWRGGRYFHTLKIERLNAHLDPKDRAVLMLEGEAVDDPANPFLKAPDFTIRLYKPGANHVGVGIWYSLVALKDFEVDKSRQEKGEGFKVAQFSSMFISEKVFDSDEASHGKVRAKFKGFGWIFPSPVRMKGKFVYLRHTPKPKGRKDKPDCDIQLETPPFSECSVQGWIAATTDPSQDNVGLWINWDKAPLRMAKGMKVGFFNYYLHANAR